jgi:hypothetical protein
MKSGKKTKNKKKEKQIIQDKDKKKVSFLI